MNIPKYLFDSCEEFNDRQLTCFSISCLGLLCNGTQEFVAANLQELEAAWELEGINLTPDFMAGFYDEMVSCFESGRSPSPSSFEQVDKSYVDRNSASGNLEPSGLLLFDFARTLARNTHLNFRSALSAERIFAEVKATLLQCLCMGLFNTSEPYSPCGEEMEKAVHNTDSLKQGVKDLEYVIDLAKAEKILPRQDRNWDYEFFQFPFDGSKNRDMDKYDRL